MITQKNIMWANSLWNPKPSENVMMTKAVIELEVLECLRKELKTRLAIAPVCPNCIGSETLKAMSVKNNKCIQLLFVLKIVDDVLGVEVEK